MNVRSGDRGRGLAPLPPGLRVASMSSRLAAWLIDSLILAAFQVGFLTLTFAVGAVRINPEAQRQMQASPLLMPTVPPYDANLPLLAVLSVVFVALNVAYPAICWARLRGMPGQRLMSIQVGSADTGGNLSYGRALIRSVVAVGIPVACLAAVLYGGFAFFSSMAWSEAMNPTPGGQADAWLSTWSAPLDLAVLITMSWPLVLLVWTVANPYRQGLHDRIARSLVVGKGTPPWADAVRWPGYGPGFVPPAHGLPPGYWAPPGQDAGPGYGSPADAWSPSSWPPGALPPSVLPPGALPPGGPPGTMPPGPDGAGDAADGSGWLQSGDSSDAVPKRHAATVGRRVAAYLLDCFVVYLVFALMETAIVLLFMPSPAANLDERTYILLGLVGGVWQLAYFTTGWAVLRGTVGQRLMHMRVADVTTGKALSWMDSVVRWAMLQGPFALLTVVPEAVRAPVMFVAPMWAMFLLYTTTNDPNLRGLHDRFLNSRVTLEA